MSLEILLRRLLIAISVITVLSGLTQMLAPRMVLDFLAAEATPTAGHFFATIGMFMICVGGVLLHTLLSRRPAPVVALWAGFQKVGAFALVALGVVNGVFAAMALGVAFFDLLSGVLILLYWRKIVAS